MVLTQETNRGHARWALAFGFAPNLGAVTFKKCIERGEEGLLRSKEAALVRPFFDRADQEAELAERSGIHIVTPLDDDYPEPLRHIYDPPAALFVKGRLAPVEKRVAIVGSRDCTDYGKKIAFELGRDLARAGCVVVSGMARGIDSAAHSGALEGGGLTWAVLGGGLLNDGSCRNKRLSEQIVESGALISEFMLREAPRPEYYPRRNRIVSGFSAGAVVVEARKDSGALITAGLALEQGRDVFAVPADLDSEFSEGSNWLLRQGAKFVRSARDVLEDLGWDPGAAHHPHPALQSLSEDEKTMMGSLKARESLHLDAWIERSGRAPSQAMATIGALLLKGLVAEKPGKYYERGRV